MIQFNMLSCDLMQMRNNFLYKHENDNNNFIWISVDLAFAV